MSDVSVFVHAWPKNAAALLTKLLIVSLAWGTPKARPIDRLSKDAPDIEGARVLHVRCWFWLRWLQIQEWLLRLLPPGAPQFHLLWKTITTHPDPVEDARWSAALSETALFTVMTEMLKLVHLPPLPAKTAYAHTWGCGQRAHCIVFNDGRSAACCALSCWPASHVPFWLHPISRFEKGDKEARKYLVQPWQLFDVRAITAQAKLQRLNLSADKIHFIPIVYEELNTLLLNTLCDEQNKFVFIINEIGQRGPHFRRLCMITKCTAGSKHVATYPLDQLELPSVY
jgi:hypothetical protein